MLTKYDTVQVVGYMRGRLYYSYFRWHDFASVMRETPYAEGVLQTSNLSIFGQLSLNEGEYIEFPYNPLEDYARIRAILERMSQWYKMTNDETIAQRHYNRDGVVQAMVLDHKGDITYVRMEYNITWFHGLIAYRLL